MRIGIDFDNTIACYDGVFHKAALDLGLIPADLGSSKNAVRDHLNGSGRKDEFTALQGHVYGARMDLVSPYPGFLAFVDRARAAGHELAIVSHKTKTPMAGPAHDLHAAAWGFLEARGIVSAARIARQNIHFEVTKEEKIARIATVGCDVFVDDLPEILQMAGFPAATRGILFDPDRHHAGKALPFAHAGSWAEISAALLDG
jgi:hypothetical protein